MTHTSKIDFSKYFVRLRGFISKIRAKWGMVVLGDTADPNSALYSRLADPKKEAYKGSLIMR